MRHHGDDVLARADAISAAYAEVFTQPPWNRAHGGDGERVRDRFRTRLESDARRAGFTLVTSESGGVIDGFGSGWRTGSPFRTDRAYPQVTASIGAGAVERLLVGAFEVDELAVREQARGRGVGRALLDALIAESPDRRAWLLTWTGAPETVAFYRHLGWHRVPTLPGHDNHIVTFLAPDHPGAAEFA